MLSKHQAISHMHLRWGRFLHRRSHAHLRGRAIAIVHCDHSWWGVSGGGRGRGWSRGWSNGGWGWGSGGGWGGGGGGGGGSLGLCGCRGWVWGRGRGRADGCCKARRLGRRCWLREISMKTASKEYIIWSGTVCKGGGGNSRYLCGGRGRWHSNSRRRSGRCSWGCRGWRGSSWRGSSSRRCSGSLRSSSLCCCNLCRIECV